VNVHLCICEATVIISCSVFWFFNALLMILDITGRPHYLLRFKIQEGKNQPVSCFSFCLSLAWIILPSLTWAVHFSALPHLTWPI